MSGIVWLGDKDRVSDDGRWHIVHRSIAPSKRWELYDVKAGNWYGDWATCKAAKERAEVVERCERRRGPITTGEGE